MGRLKEVLMGHEGAIVGCRERLPRPFKEVLDFALGEISLRLMTEPEEAIETWNKESSVRDYMQLFLDKGDGSLEQQARWERELRKAEKKLARVKERFPDIEELVAEHRQAWQATRAEILGE